MKMPETKLKSAIAPACAPLASSPLRKIIKTPTCLLAFAFAFGLGLAIAADKTPHWGYQGNAGPAHWGSMEKEFASCKLGRQQSPVDILTKSVEKAQLPAIKAAYKESAGTLANNGHTIQVDLADGGGAGLPSGEYKLVQFHFHTPSEEMIDGRRFALVAHLVHKNAAGNLAVIAVLFKGGKENAALKDIFNSLPAREGKEALKTNFDASGLLPVSLGYYAFMGSLTTPPCSEEVAWHVLKQPVEMSSAQIGAFRKIFKMNARPVQPLNGRRVLEAE